MSTLSTDKKPLVDYGVQIRFIKDLHDTGGGYPEKSTSATPPSSKYGVAVHVQGISGQPYLVLKDGEKGDSYGVQLKAQPLAQSPAPGPTSRYNSLGRDQKPLGFMNPYSPVGNTRSSSVSPADFEEGETYRSPLKRPPGDGQAVGHVGDGERRAGAKADSLPKRGTDGTGEKPGFSRENSGEFNEAGLKPVKRSGAGTRAVRQNGFTSAGSLGRHSGKAVRQNFPLESFPEGLPSSSSSFSSSSSSSSSTPPPAAAHPPPPSASATGEEEPAAVAIDTNSLAPINKLISKFNSSAPGSAAQTRGRTGARQRLRFDERQRSRSLDARKEAEEPRNPPPASSATTPTPNPNPYTAALAPPSTPTARTPASAGSPGVSTVAAVSAPAVATVTAPAVTSSPRSSTYAASSFAASPRSFVAKDHPAVAKKPETAASLRPHPLSRSLDVSGEEDAGAKRAIYNILKDGSIESDASINRKVNLIYDKTNTLKQYRALQGGLVLKLAEGRMAREGAESAVRQQEDQLAEMQEELRRISEGSPHGDDSLRTDMATLQAELAEAAMLRLRQEETLHQRERELTALKGALKEEVESHDGELETLREHCRERGDTWKTQLETTTQELRATEHELQKSRLEKEEFEVELRDLQDSVSSMKKQMPGLDEEHFEAAQRCHDDLKRTRAELDKQKAEFDEKCAELRALRAAGEETEARLRSEMDRLRDQSQSDKAALEKAKESQAGSSTRPAGDPESTQELHETNARLRERLSRLRLQSSMPLSSEAEETVEALEDENRALKTQLDEAKRGVARLGKEKEELGRRLDERDQERDALRRGKSDLEEQKRLLDRSVMGLQTQLEEYRDRSRKDLLEAQRSGKDRQGELQRAQTNLKAQQDEVSRLKKDLLACSEERDGAQLERDLLNGRLKHLEGELEGEKNTYTDRSREIRSLEDKFKSLEIELDEEKNNVELLNDRIARSRELVDQLRSELMQERSARHDLEMNRGFMERQVKELKGRVADMETPSRPPAALGVLEKRVLELEELLHSEEREKATIMSSQRRLERKLKDLNATMDQDRNLSAEQKDQLSLRVKALKRQVDESECEVERLEGVRRKGLRELEEQQEQREVLQAKVTALEAELKRRVQHTRSLVLSSVNLSSEDEEAFYDNGSLGGSHAESHLQNTTS
ncbi:hypothetical protein NHX12_023330 [Muraenolepis orangiensis]|uniref:Myosin tail domain-containing protein n=1 Tax=Muraenolepis orangiensis TaxID=630683 RepID=A0A9Q0ISN4_9TELE|nr:hypothetical protein NHX12_023330 [Muraenolepis orangiensis]